MDRIYQSLPLKKKYFFLIVGICIVLCLSPVPAQADTGETMILTQEECKDSLEGALKSIALKLSLPKGEVDFTSLTLYFLNEGEGVYYQAEIENAEEEGETTLRLPPGVYRLDNSFTQFDGFYNLNYTSELDVETFEVGGEEAERGEVLVKIESRFLTQYENNLAIHYRNPSHFPGLVRLTLEGNTDLDAKSHEKYEVELKEGEETVSLIMKSGTYRVTDVSLELEGRGEAEETGNWKAEYETGDIVIHHHGDTDMEVSVFKEGPEGDETDGEGKKFSVWMLLEIFPIFFAVLYGGSKFFQRK